MTKIVRLPAFEDNYLWLVQGRNQKAFVVDPGDAKPVLDYLEQNDLVLTDILITHHHADHIGGVNTLLASFPDCNVFGPSTSRFTMVTHPCQNGDSIKPEATIDTYEVISVPGHTIDHIAFYAKPNLFIGDTLFSVGCGRLFEGTPEQMHQSLESIKSLPNDTKVFCAHEYTKSNCDFALNVTPRNDALLSYSKQVNILRKADAATIPTLLATEKLVNPFLRVSESDVRQAVIEKFSMNQNCSDTEVFANLRKWKDSF